MEEELKKEDFGNHLPGGLDAQEMVNIPYIVRCMSKGKDHLSRQRPGDLINMDCYEDADWFMLPIASVLTSFCDVLSSGRVPDYVSGTSDSYSPQQDRSKMSPRQKFDEDIRVLLERLPYVVYLATLSDQTNIAEDEFTRGIREMSATKNVPLWLVFAAQCFLESHHALRENVFMAHAQLWQQALWVRNAANDTFRYHQNLKVENWPQMNDDAMRHFLVDEVNAYILNDPIHNTMAKKVREQGLPSEPAFYLYRENPLWCGILLFTLHLRAQELGITFANAWGSVLYTAHLYNAVRKEQACAKQWPEMEALIDIHSAERMFVGGLPDNPDQYLKRFLICMGYSTTSFHQGERNRGLAASKRGPRGLLEVSPLSQLFKRRFCEKRGELNFDLEQVEQFLNNIFESATDWDKIVDFEGNEVIDIEIRQRARKAISSRVKREHKLAPLELLLALHGSLERESSELSFDYLGFHQKCWSLLRELQITLHTQLLNYLDPGYLDQENQLPFVVGYIFATAAQSDKAARAILKMKQGKTTSKLLHAAGQGVMEWIGRCEELDRRRGREVVIEEATEPAVVTIGD